jgi:hypothetical protein
VLLLCYRPGILVINELHRGNCMSVVLNCLHELNCKVAIVVRENSVTHRKRIALCNCVNSPT